MTTAPHHGARDARRRVLARMAGALAMLPFAGALVAMVGQRRRGRPPRRVRIAPDFRDDVAFGDGLIVSRAGDGRVAVFSSSCTHLGCRISRVEDGLLVCPCHGSRFGRDGSVVNGPATRPLTQLAFTTDPASGEFTIDVV